VIGCHHIVKHAQTVPRLCFKEPVQITATVPRKLLPGLPWFLTEVSGLNVLNGAQRLNYLNVLNKFILAAVRNVPDVSR